MPRSKRTATVGIPTVRAEFASVKLGDARRVRRLGKLVDAFCASPERGLPEIARDSAELEGIYRFLGNDAFGADALLTAHYERTSARVAEFPTVIVGHDISTCEFPLLESNRKGLSPLSGDEQGFRLQASLALAGDGSCRPLGLLNTETWADKVTGRTKAGRWIEFVKKSEARAAGRSRLIHVIDREGGAFELFHEIMSRGSGFVIRLTNYRNVECEKVAAGLLRIGAVAERLESVKQVEVALSKRRRIFQDPVNPARDARVATLAFAAAPIRLRRSGESDALPKLLDVNLVCVREIHPPPGEKPIEWLLATTEPIATAEQVARVVDIYRARWRIEEFFKALKTGCALKKRQLESFDALKKILAVSLVVAWRILLLRHESRHAPEGPATIVLSKLQLQVLRAAGRVPLSPRPSNREVLYAVAALGGHIKNNGDPGWLVLGRGMERLFERVEGWTCALRAHGLGEVSDVAIDA
jgi:hypothetical protein